VFGGAGNIKSNQIYLLSGHDMTVKQNNKGINGVSRTARLVTQALTAALRHTLQHYTTKS